MSIDETSVKFTKSHSMREFECLASSDSLRDGEKYMLGIDLHESDETIRLIGAIQVNDNEIDLEPLMMVEYKDKKLYIPSARFETDALLNILRKDFDLSAYRHTAKYFSNNNDWKERKL